MRSASSRTENATKNLKVALICKMGLFGMAFISRTLFIRILGAEYTGISSLYSNILGLLNLAELGFGSVLTYELYKPLKDNDQETILCLVSLFKRIYTVVLIVVLCCGLSLIPFLKYIVNSDLDTRDLLIYYLLYLIDSVASYFAAYRYLVIEADQKKYVITLTDIVIKFVMYICQSIYLIMTRNFLGYLILQVIFTFLDNIALNSISQRMYPFLKNIPRKIPDNSVNKQRIYSNARAMFVTKISNVVLNQTDSIIISALLGTIYVGLYSNYFMLITYINSIYTMICTSFEAGIGNLNADGNMEKSFLLYKQANFIMFCINLCCTVGFICVVQDFIVLWIGKKYLQNISLILSLMFTFYIQNSMRVTSIYRQTMGMFEATKKYYPVMAGMNVILSLFLGKWLGITGVALATGVSCLCTAFWYEGKIVFNKLGHGFHEYILQQAGNALVVVMTTICSYFLCTLAPFDGIIEIIIKGFISLFTVILVLFVVFHRTEEWNWTVTYVRNIFRKVRFHKKNVV